MQTRRPLIQLTAVLVLAACSSTAGLDRETTRNAITGQRPQFTKCYDQSLQDKSAPTDGRVVVKFHVQPDGVVKTAETTESTMSAALGSCLVDSAKKIKFPVAEN